MGGCNHSWFLQGLAESALDKKGPTNNGINPSRCAATNPAITASTVIIKKISSDFRGLMIAMIILALSDVTEWKGYEKIVDSIQPNILTLAGDLTSDGFASFWRYKNDKNFLRIKEVHVNNFYQFLRYAGRKSEVLVIKGDHDEDFEGDYVPEKINKIIGCKEISGKTADINGIRFLGLGFKEAHRFKEPKSTTEWSKRNIDIVVMHGENIRFVSLLKPKIIVKGGLFTGTYLVNDIPSVFTGSLGFTVIELKNKAVSKISEYAFDLKSQQITSKKFPPIPALKKYGWIKPYHKS